MAISTIEITRKDYYEAAAQAKTVLIAKAQDFSNVPHEQMMFSYYTVLQMKETLEKTMDVFGIKHNFDVKLID